MKTIMVLTVMVLGATWAFADTVFFTDGSSLDGIVTHPDSNTILINIGTRSLTIDASTVSRVETNDNKGDEAALLALLAKQQEQAVAARTSMTDEERDRVREALTPLWSPDELVRANAHRSLKTLNRELPVFLYIDISLPFTKGAIAPELLSVLVELDAARAKDVLSRYTINVDPGIRGKVLELLGAYHDGEDVGTIANGMVDVDSSVQLGAAHALGDCGQKAASPILIRGLDSQDTRFKNACLAALKKIWGPEGVGLTTPAQWQEFWAANSSGVTDPVDPDALTPLVSQEQLDKATASHDE
jgi:hypothetical protein